MIDRRNDYRIRYEPPGFFDMLREMAVELVFCGCLLILGLGVMFAYGQVMLHTVAL